MVFGTGPNITDLLYNPQPILRFVVYRAPSLMVEEEPLGQSKAYR